MIKLLILNLSGGAESGDVRDILVKEAKKAIIELGSESISKSEKAKKIKIIVNNLRDKLSKRRLRALNKKQSDIIRTITAQILGLPIARFKDKVDESILKRKQERKDRLKQLQNERLRQLKEQALALSRAIIHRNDEEALASIIMRVQNPQIQRFKRR